MSHPEEKFIYIMAAEKMVSLLDQMDQTLNFFYEYQIQCENSVRKELAPMLLKLTTWMNKDG